MRYVKADFDGVTEYHGPGMGDSWFAANGWIAYRGTLPASRLDIIDGVIVELPEPEPTEEWVGKEAFINALYALLPTDHLMGLVAQF